MPQLLTARDARQSIEELLSTSLPRFEGDLRELQKNLEAAPPQPRTAGPTPRPAPTTAVNPNYAIISGQQKYTDLRVPVLAIYASPHNPGPPVSNDPTALAAFEARDKTRVDAIAQAFEKGAPSARVILLPRANHYLFQSNEADVLREIHAFIDSLPMNAEDGAAAR